MPSQNIYTARWRNWDYGDQANLDFGQIITIDKESPNNERLLALGYMTCEKVSNPTILECMMCGSTFLREADRDAHGRKRHPSRSRQMSMSPGGPINPTTGEPSMMLDTEGDREEREMMRETPLHLEKTAASLQA